LGSLGLPCSRILRLRCSPHNAIFSRNEGCCSAFSLETKNKITATGIRLVRRHGNGHNGVVAVVIAHVVFEGGNSFCVDNKRWVPVLVRHRKDKHARTYGDGRRSFRWAYDLLVQADHQTPVVPFLRYVEVESHHCTRKRGLQGRTLGDGA